MMKLYKKRNFRAYITHFLDVGAIIKKEDVFPGVFPDKLQLF